MNYLLLCDPNDCAYIDCSRGYQATFENVRSAVLANEKRYLCGGNVDKFEVRVALQNYLPDKELEFAGNTWRWDREHQRGTLVKTGQAHDNACLLFIPHVTNEQLLRQAIESVLRPNLNIWVLDSSFRGLDLAADWLAPCSVLRLPHETVFTHMQNAIMKIALASNTPYLLFMHSDARAHDKNVVPDLLNLMGGKVGVAFTNYDALACFDMRCVRDVGFWDESYDWYSSDCDYYHRVRAQGWEAKLTDLGARVDHIVSATLKSGDKFRHSIDPVGWHMGHHAHKWQGGCGGETAPRPYGVAAESVFLDDLSAAYVFETYQRAEQHFKVLSSAVPHAEGNISWGTASLYCEVFLSLRRTEQALQNAPRILEIGFNAGHMSALLAECFPDAEIVSVDQHWHDYVPASFERVRAMSSVKRTLINGDSRQEVPKLSGKFDLIIIDGGRLDDVPASDLRNCKLLSHDNTIVMVDDICNQYAHLPPTAAWKKAVERGEVVELGRRMTSDGNLGFTFGKYRW